MCLCGIVDAVEEFFKSVVACACCLILGGPALIIAGSILLNEKDNRKAFNDAVKDFNPTPMNAWTGTINNVPITVRRESLNVKGVDAATSVFAEAVVPVPDPSSSGLQVSVNVNTVTPFVRRVPFHVTPNATYACSSSDCRGGRDCKCKRDLRRFEAKCNDRGGILVPAPKWCKADEFCGECLQHLYLRQLYLVVRETGNGKYAEDTELLSANYDFGAFDNDYQPGIPSRVTVRLYSSTDPYIALQRLTKGTNQFGMNPRTVGIVLIVLGCLFLLLEIGVCTALICYWTRSKKTSSGAPPHVAAAPHGIPMMGGPGNTPPKFYAPPAQQTGQGYPYSQPAPGYTYGQPPPEQSVPQGYMYGPTASQGYAYGQQSSQGYMGGPPASQGYAYGQPAPPLPHYGHTYGKAPPPL